MKCNLCNREMELSAYDSHFAFCKHCGMHQKKELTSWSTTGTPWEKDHLKTYLEGEAWRRKIFEGRLNLLELFMNETSSILDIGSAAGLFINEASKRKYKKVSAVETDVLFREYSKKINQNCSHFDSLADVDGEFDLITIFDTVGYATNLKWFMGKIVQQVKNGGYLFISSVALDCGMKSVDDKSFNYFFEDNFWDEQIPEHYALKVVKRFKEVKNFNTKVCRSKEWWDDYLFSDNKKKMNYIIYKKEA